MNVFPITFEVPAHPEPIAFVKQWALGLRAFGGGAGQHYEVPTDLEAISAIRVLVPKGPIEVFNAALEMLVAVNLWCIRAANKRVLGRHGSYSSVYDAVCYKPKVKSDDELWDSIEALHQRGHGVCEDLACSRVAERRFIGDWCRPFLIPQAIPNGILFHVVVQNPDGSIEDPSGVLGMENGKVGDRTTRRCKLFLRKEGKKDCGCEQCKAGGTCPCKG